MLKFYANPISPYAQRVMFFFDEAAVPHDFVMLRSDDLLKEPFTRVSSFRTVPALEAGGFTLTESLAMLRYLAQKFHKSAWYPENLEERARIDQLMDYSECLARPLMDLGKEIAMAPHLGRETNVAKVEALRAELTKYLPRFETYIAGRDFAVGGALTIADAALAPFLHMYKYAQHPMTDFPETKRYADRMADRPSMQKVLAAAAEAFRARKA